MLQKLNVDKFKTGPFDLSKLSDVVKMNSLKWLYMMNWSKTLTLFRLLIIVIKLKKVTMAQK